MSNNQPRNQPPKAQGQKGQGQKGQGAQKSGQKQGQGKKQKRRSRSRPAKQTSPADFWRASPELGPLEPIEIPDDPTALLRSLGTPPLPGQSTVADHYFTAVIERASGLATALAAAGGLLDVTDDDD